MAQVLIVDDESVVRQVIRRWVEDAGHHAREAESATAALASLADAPADVILCDVQMPGADGLWLTGQVRNTYPLTAVVLATGVRFRSSSAAWSIRPLKTRHSGLRSMTWWPRSALETNSMRARGFR